MQQRNGILSETVSNVEHSNNPLLLHGINKTKLPIEFQSVCSCNIEKKIVCVENQNVLRGSHMTYSQWWHAIIIIVASVMIYMACLFFNLFVPSHTTTLSNYMISECVVIISIADRTVVSLVYFDCFVFISWPCNY